MSTIFAFLLENLFCFIGGLHIYHPLCLIRDLPLFRENRGSPLSFKDF